MGPGRTGIWGSLGRGAGCPDASRVEGYRRAAFRNLHCKPFAPPRAPAEMNTRGRSVGFPKKLRPALGGELAAREPVWDGEGWGCDRVAGSIIPYVLAVAGAGGRNSRATITERDPDIGIALRLPLDEAVAGLGPGQDVFVLVV